MFIFSEPCPASNATCTKNPEPTKGQGLTVIFSDATRMNYDDFFRNPGTSADQFAASAPPIEPTKPSPYPAISNLAQTILASVQIDLGNPSPSNFLLNRSVVDKTIFDKINTTMVNTTVVNSKLYLASTNQSAPPFTLEGPATIQALYSCRLQLAKPLGSAVISVIVATLSMFMSGWGAFIFLSSEYAERKRKSESPGRVK